MAHAAIAFLLLLPLLASAQVVTEPALKAAFIYNFARYTDWPADVMSADAPFVMCVLGDSAVGIELERVVKTRELAGHNMTVSYPASAGTQRECQLLYLSGITARESAELVAGLRDVPVLTISDIEGFTNWGGIAQFFYEYGQLRFSIGLGSAKRARLKISSNVLALAKRTK